MRHHLRFTAACVIVLVLSIGFPQNAFADSIRRSEWIVAKLNIEKAHSYSDGKGVIVGLVDTGVDGTHPDLTGNVIGGADFSNPAKQNGSGTGLIDAYGHGTAMAGLIDGHGHGLKSQDGILGVSPGARILSVRDGISDGGSGTQMANAITWAVRHGASVICIAQGASLGNVLEKQAIDYAESKDTVIVASAGNVPGSSTVEYPAAYSGVIAAAATDVDNLHASVSVTGPQIVLSAPGTNIYSDGLDHAYSVGSGTSPATAIIAGAAALVRSRFPKLSAVEVIHRLTATATDLGPPGRDDEYGYGELNLVAALTANVPPLTTTVTPRPIHTATLPSASASTPAPTPATTIEVSKGASAGTSWLPLTAVVIVIVGIVILLLVARRARSSRSP